MKKYFQKRKSGYTIIETMISISLFLVVVMVGMDSLLNANVVHRKSQDMRSIMDSLNFVMEDMSRNIRTGYDIQCFRKGTADSNPPTQGSLGAPRSCADGFAIAFEYASGNSSDFADQWVYYINGGRIYKSTSGADASDFYQLSPNEVVIDSISGFSVLGAEAPATNTQQPLVTIRLVGKITSKNNLETPFSLQTSVSQRLIDVE